MFEEAQAVYRTFALILGVGVAGFVLRILLAIALRNRFSPGLAPGLTDPVPQAFFMRALSLIGIGARPLTTLGEVRLRATLGLKLAHLAALAVVAMCLQGLHPSLFGIGNLLLLPVAYATLLIFVLEIRYDRDAITLPRWWFGSTTHRWDDLLALRTNDPWFLVFHFEKGVTVRVNKYLVGHDDLLETARRAMRET